MPRFDIPSSIRKLVLERYGQACVVCGKSESTDVAHIYEDAAKRAAKADRLVVLCSNHNQAQERAHGESTPGLPQEMRPTNLLTTARTDYWQGAYAQGYGKARLAAYLSEKQREYSLAIECLTEAVSAARPLRWGDWLAATIAEAERICLSHSVGIATRWLLLDRFALVLFDYGRWRESTDVMSAAVQLRDRVNADPYNPQRLADDKRAAFRRESLIRALTRSLAPGENLPVILEELETQAREFEKQGKLDAFATHLDVARRLLLEGGKREKAHKHSEEVLQKRTKILHKWVLLEHLISEAEYFSLKKDRDKALYYASEAMTLYSRNPVILEPVFDSSPLPLGIHERIQRIGINESDLLARGVTVGARSKVTPLGLTSRSVTRICRNILGSG